MKVYGMYVKDDREGYTPYLSLCIDISKENLLGCWKRTLITYPESFNTCKFQLIEFEIPEFDESKFKSIEEMIDENKGSIST